MKQEGMMVRKTIKWIAVCAVGVVAFSASAVDFSKAGYWEAEGSPRRVETLTTGWEFSLDGFKTSKRVTLPPNDVCAWCVWSESRLAWRKRLG